MTAPDALRAREQLKRTSAAIVFAVLLSACGNEDWRETQLSPCPDCEPVVVERPIAPMGLYTNGEELFATDLYVPVLEAYSLEDFSSRIVGDNLPVIARVPPIPVGEELWFYSENVGAHGIIAVAADSGRVRQLFPEALRQATFTLSEGPRRPVARLSRAGNLGVRLVELDDNAEVEEVIDAIDGRTSSIQLFDASPAGVFWGRYTVNDEEVVASYQLLTRAGERFSWTLDTELPLGTARFNAQTLYFVTEGRFYEFDEEAGDFVNRHPGPRGRSLNWTGGYYWWLDWTTDEMGNPERSGLSVAPDTNLAASRFYLGAFSTASPVAARNFLYLTNSRGIFRLPLETHD